MAPLIALVHAPVLGPRSWLPVADELSRAGSEVVVPALAGFTDGGAPYAPRLVRLAADQVRSARRGDVVLVTHSGAGAFVPHLAAAIGGDLVAVRRRCAAEPVTRRNRGRRRVPAVPARTRHRRRRPAVAAVVA